MIISGDNGKVVINLSRHFIPTKIVSGFPAIGKSYIAKRFPTVVRDLESSDYHWLKDPKTGDWKLDEEGKKIPNPEWPNNYIQDIKVLERSGMYRSVMVSSHVLVRTEMAKAGIKYTNLLPENTPVMKNIILERCKFRNSPPEFIENLDKNWDEYINSLINDSAAVAKIQLNPQSINMWSAWMLMM